MNKLKGSFPAKAAAVLLFCLLCLGFAFSAAAVGMLYSAGFYSRGAEAARKTMTERLCYDEALLIADHVLPLNDEGGDNVVLADSANFRYEIYDADGVLRFSTYAGEETLCSVTVPCSNWYPYYAFREGELWGEESAASDGEGAAAERTEPLPTPQAEPLLTPLPEGVTPVPVPTEPSEISPEPTPTPRPATPGDVYAPRGRTVSFTVVCCLLRDMTQRDSVFFQLRCFDFAAAGDRALIGAAVGSFLLALALFVFLMGAAGHRKDTNEIKARFTEKIPFDLFTAAIGAAGAGVLYLLIEILDHLNRMFALRLTAAALLFCAAVLLALWWCMSFAVRVKMGGLIRGTLCYKLLHLLLRAAKRIWDWLKMLALSLPLVWRGILFYLVFAFAGQLLMIAFERSAPYLWFLGCLVLFPVVVWLLLSARRLRVGAKEIAGGNTGYIVPTKYLFGEFRRHADDLNAIQSGISRAVEERLRSERMKTELITNVSHDIKTPLTSIISYVDLLSKEEIESEKAREYLSVLQRQSARLKKLTDDLLEASKASSGALAVTIEDCDLSVMLDQTAGEYGEKLAEKGLTLVVRKGEGSVPVRADARHTQRIFDNLMSNVLKYALPGTRVYLELREGDSGPTVIFRNTSQTEIVQSPEELTERFVRGDASRSSEGSGLGLSIARSLAELQGGSLTVTVDGDLFKVTLGFAE